MRITSVTVRVRDAAAGAAALAALLGLRTEEDLAGPFVRIGWTVVRPIATSGSGVDHLAILIPGDAYPEAEAWVRERATPTGTAIAGPPGWVSTSVYFDGPDEAVLELIAHVGHRPQPGATFPEALLGVCEVGIAVEDVDAAIDASGLPPFAGTVAPDFAAIGDRDGRLILASPGRVWFPTEDRLAGAGPLVVVAESATPTEVRLGEADLTVVRRHTVGSPPPTTGEPNDGDPPK